MGLTFPASLDSHRLNKAVFFAADRRELAAYLAAAWSVAWDSGQDMADGEVLARLAGDLGWLEAAFVDFTGSAEAEARRRSSTLEAEGRGVFGVPTMMIGEEMWWGNDRLDFLREHLRGS